jgi:hypothetical protein
MSRSLWRVRVSRLVEDWVEVTAATKIEAEVAAVGLPGVRNVFAGSAISADFNPAPRRPAGVHDEDE